MKEDIGLNNDNVIKSTLSSHLDHFILCNSEQIMKNFIKEISGFCNSTVYC